MNFFLLVLALSVGLAFSQIEQPVICNDCDPVPTAAPTPEPWQCYYIIVDGVKRKICE